MDKKNVEEEDKLFSKGNIKFLIILGIIIVGIYFLTTRYMGLILFNGTGFKEIPKDNLLNSSYKNESISSYGIKPINVDNQYRFYWNNTPSLNSWLVPIDGYSVLKATDYDSSIQKSANDIYYQTQEEIGQGASSSAFKKALYQNILNYVYNDISYNYEDEQQISYINMLLYKLRLKTSNINAISAFENKGSICSGKAELFASYCRALGLPVKLVNGIYNNGSIEGGHSWNEITIDNVTYILDSTSSNAMIKKDSTEGSYYKTNKNSNTLYLK